MRLRCKLRGGVNALPGEVHRDQNDSDREPQLAVDLAKHHSTGNPKADEGEHSQGSRDLAGGKQLCNIVA